MVQTAVFRNNSREVAGLLGITVIGAVLRAQQGISLHGGASAPQAFLAVPGEEIEAEGVTANAP
jgi:hypothetical protein